MYDDIKSRIHNLVLKYEQNRDYYRTASFNETMLRCEFLDPFFELLGWDIKNTSGKSTRNREVLMEEPLKDGSTRHTKKPDYTFRLYGERKFFVEAKKPCVNINAEDGPAKQVRRYGYTAGLKISVLSNFEYLYIYDTTYLVSHDDNREKALLKSYHYSEYEERAEELFKELGRDSVYDGRFDEEWDDLEQNASHKPVDYIFLAQINRWRLMLGREIFSLIDTDEIDLGDIVQSYINKILFLRVCEDRNIEDYHKLIQIAELDDGKLLLEKFHEADKKYNSGLFKERLSSDVVCNIKSSFWNIIRELYYPESPYSFSVLSSDILGSIYEMFVSQRFEIVEGTLTLVNKPDNVDKDIVTTPKYIINEILNKTVSDYIANADETALLEMKFADISCGSGAFLLELYQLLCDHVTDLLISRDPKRLIKTGLLYKLPFDLKRKLLTSCIFGVDKDYNAVEACKFGLLLKLLEGEDDSTLPGVESILPSLDGNIFFGNSLLSSGDVTDELSQIVNPFEFGNMKFDVIVGNPPYMKTEDMKRITPKEFPLYKKNYRSAYKQYDKYFLFLERALQLLKADGMLGYIIPSKFMKVGAARKIREIITKGKRVKSITSFGAHQVFSDKSNYTCLLILQNQENDEFTYSEVADFKSWKVSGNKTLNTCKRPASSIDGDTWVIYTDTYKHLLEDKIFPLSRPISELLGDDCTFNGIQTSANMIYIFTPLRENKEYYTFKAYNGKEYDIEKRLTKPYFKTDRTGDYPLHTYKVFEPNARVIYPYKKNKNGRIRLIPLEEIKNGYPLLYKYLMDSKDKLDRADRDIKPRPKTNDEWHRYGRQQSLESCEIPEKLIVGVLSAGDKYAVDNKGTLVSSGGTAGYCVICSRPDKKYSIYYIQAILSSVQGEWLASLYGEIFRGGYIARGSKVLMQIPIRVIDFSDEEDVRKHDDIVRRQRKLISLGEKLSNAKGNSRKSIPLQRRFDLLREEQQNAINALYRMTKEEQSIIPLIKEIYAAD